MHEARITVPRSARYFILGDEKLTRLPRQVWFVLHGYAQIAPRFIRHFEVLDDGKHVVLAPEGLSRFYLPGTSGHSDRVGASWMTREDRLSEIGDYVRYLDLVYDAIFTRIDRASTDLVVLGFSQGVATACRWITMSTKGVRPDHVILWSAEIPPELDLDAAHTALDGRVTLVRGSGDELVTAQLMTEQGERLRRHGIAHRFETFDGGHHLDPAVIKRLSETTPLLAP
ncbi:MAG: alpha/beta hydrolase [Gemmatimonadaceae bacterium]